MYAVGAGLDDLVSLSPEVLVRSERLAVGYSELLAGFVALDDVLGIDVEVFGLGNDPLSLLELLLELGGLRRFLQFGHHPPVPLLGIPPLLPLL
jgi:hypothetical protein